MDMVYGNVIRVHIVQNMLRVSVKYIIFVLLVTIRRHNLVDSKCVGDTGVRSDLPFCIGQEYRRDALPHQNDNPINITILANILEILDINDLESTVSISLRLGMSWIDPRLNVNHNSLGWLDDDDDDVGVRYTYLNSDWRHKLWIPDIDIINIKRFKTGKVLGGEFTLKLFEDKRLWYEVQVEITISCPLFNFKKYPFDRQVCVLLIGSFRYDIKKTIYMGYLVDNKENQRMLNYNVENVEALSFRSCILSHEHYYFKKEGNIGYTSHAHSYFGIKMEFHRLLQPHLRLTYFPSILLVIISWIGFLFGVSKVVARVGLQVTILLVLIKMR